MSSVNFRVVVFGIVIVSMIGAGVYLHYATLFLGAFILAALLIDGTANSHD